MLSVFLAFQHGSSATTIAAPRMFFLFSFPAVMLFMQYRFRSCIARCSSSIEIVYVALLLTLYCRSLPYLFFL